MRIVHVDDDQDVRLLVAMLLGDRHHVDSYDSVLHAQQQADWPKTDAAIVDVMMPGASGDVLLGWLNDEHPHVRRIICSAVGVRQLDTARFGIAHDLITKPFDTDALEAALDAR